jgi:hypothetical protein
MRPDSYYKKYVVLQVTGSSIRMVVVGCFDLHIARHIPLSGVQLPLCHCGSLVGLSPHRVLRMRQNRSTWHYSVVQVLVSVGGARTRSPSLSPLR